MSHVTKTEPTNQIKFQTQFLLNLTKKRFLSFLILIFAGPKRGRPTPGFSIFVCSFVRSFIRSFVRLFGGSEGRSSP